MQTSSRAGRCAGTAPALNMALPKLVPLLFQAAIAAGVLALQAYCYGPPDVLRPTRVSPVGAGFGILALMLCVLQAPIIFLFPREIPAKGLLGLFTPPAGPLWEGLGALIPITFFFGIGVIEWCYTLLKLCEEPPTFPSVCVDDPALFAKMAGRQSTCESAVANLTQYMTRFFGSGELACDLPAKLLTEKVGLESVWLKAHPAVHS